MDALAMKKELVKELFDIGAVKFGEFKLKSGIISPFYIDLRVIISKPKLVRMVSQLMWEEVKGAYEKTFELICGVPYTGLPIASCMSLDTNVSMVMKRKEAKDYGTKKMVEGIFQGGESCLIVEDIITSGFFYFLFFIFFFFFFSFFHISIFSFFHFFIFSFLFCSFFPKTTHPLTTGASVLETIESLKHVDLKATEIVVLVDREQGGRKRLKDLNLSVSCVLTISFVMEVLQEKKLLSPEIVAASKKFIQDNQVWPLPSSPAPSPSPKPLTYGERAGMTTNKVAKQVFELMEKKKTNLCLSADTTDKEKLLELIEQTGPYLCMLKVLSLCALVFVWILC